MTHKILFALLLLLSGCSLVEPCVPDKVDGRFVCIEYEPENQ